MKIAIAASENHLKSMVDPHFGRCNWFCIYDSDSKQSEFFENPARHLQENAGHEASNFLINKNINIAIAGRFGSKAVNLFKKHNIQQVIPAKDETITEIIFKIK